MHDSHQVLALLNQALQIMSAPSSPLDWRLQNELRACRNKLAAKLTIAECREISSEDPSDAILAPVVA
jgi:hypothetical protein